MLRHSVFKLNEKPLHQKGRILRMSKAYTNQDFAKPTVLTDDVFPYVTFFYASHSRAMKFINPVNKTKYRNPNQYKYDFYWNLAETFYRAAKMLPFEASPVAAYYCMLNAAKSYLSYSSVTADVFVDQFGMHGILEDIRGSKRLWYMKRSQLTGIPDAEVINLNTMTINMAAMHRVSEIARYKPEQLSRLMKSKENWLLHEYISQALDQFIDELATEITKQDIMCTGQKM